MIDLVSYRPGPWHLLLDRASGRTRKAFRFDKKPWQGWYERAEGQIVAVYRDGDALYLRVGDREWDLGRVTTKWTETGEETARFEVLVDGETVFETSYRVPIGWLDRRDPEFERSQNDMFLAVHQLVGAPRSWKDAFRG